MRTIDIFLNGFTVEIPDEVDITDEEAVYKAAEPLVGARLRELAETIGFDFEPYDGE